MDIAGLLMCAGRYFASESLFLSIAHSVHCFDLHTVPGESIPVGKPFSLARNTAPFKVKTTVRSSGYAKSLKDNVHQPS
jgi:hypothetical protein